ncbi:DUF6113 family protein [Frankia sp. EI5c]|uniref:DUF6113 family protein n=1 Tax=Frankia sp. EI5c TaxID=683316 RepID=UPI001F5B23F9|nr:DUF6113 family protein [Frankia sp. EI5c]
MPRPKAGHDRDHEVRPDQGTARAARAGSGGAAGATGGGKTQPVAGGAQHVGVDRGDAEPGRLFLGASYAFGVVAGFALGLYGVVLVAEGPRPGGFLISVGLLLALFGNAGLAYLMRWLTGTRLGAMVVLAGWTPVVLALASSRTEGDVLLRASAAGYLFLLFGLLAPVVVAVVGQARRGLTALPPAARAPRAPSR